LQTDFDLAIVGSGFGGAMLAMVARRLGLSVVLLERGTHPRFAIGESTSPLMNLLIEELARRYDLPRLLPLTTFGAWQRTYPEVTCGLKRGFTYYHHEWGQPFANRPDRSDQLLVAASPSDAVSDTHWLRSDVDFFLVKEAIALGAEYLDEMKLSGFERNGNITTLTGERHGQPMQLRASLVVDATGPRGFLSRALNLPESDFPGYPPTQTLFSHFTGVRRCEEMDAFRNAERPPYAPDDAALHHVFEGGWMWVLRFGNGVTSAGFAVTDAMASRLDLTEKEAAWERFLDSFPTVREQFAEAKPVQPFFYSPRLSYRSAVVAGDGWVMLPSAAAFIDPLFSTGMPLTLLGIERLGRIFENEWGSESLPARLQNYAEITLAEADWVAHFVGACYAAFPQFPLFASFSLFYFAAASFSEMARRLEKRHLARRFLLADEPAFATGLRACAAVVQDERRGSDAGWFREEVARHIAFRNVAGLADAAKRNWYGVDLEDVVRSAGKLEMTAEAMREVLRTAEWAKTEG
jgi:tetracycline 7-halogenase / FADH2 O2-dependent halogenase